MSDYNQKTHFSTWWMGILLDARYKKEDMNKVITKQFQRLSNK